MQKTVKLTQEMITLGDLLKLAGVADSGGQAKLMVQEGMVSVNGEVCRQRGRKLRKGDVVDVALEPGVRVKVG